MDKNLRILVPLKYISLATAFLCVGYLYAEKKSDQKSAALLRNAPGQTLSKQEQRLFTYYFYEAANSKAIEQYDAAYDYLSNCYLIDSTNAAVLNEMGNYFSLLQKKEQALEFFQRAVKYDNSNYYYNLALANYSFEQKKYDLAIATFNKLVQLRPDKVEVYPYLAEAYSQSGDKRQAIETLNKLEAIVGLNDKISMQKFQLYALLNEKEKGYQEIQKYIAKYPNEPKYMILLGDIYLKDNKTKDAWAMYSKAQQIDPDNAYLINSLARYYDQTGQHDEAEKTLSVAVLNNKINIDDKIGLLTQYVGLLQQEKKDLSPINALFDSLMIQNPQEPKLNILYGNLLMMQGKKKDANFQYQIYAEANPTDPTGWEQLLRTTFPDSIDASMKICQTAINYLPEQPTFYFYLGLCQYQKNLYQKALDTYKSGIKYVDPQNTQMLSEFYGQIGDLYYRLEAKDSAYSSYDKALEINPQNLGVLNNYSYFLSLEKNDLGKAERMSSVTVKAEPANPTYLDTYGWILYQQKEYSMAKSYIEKAINYSGDNLSAEVLEHYGDVLYMTGDKEKALEYWKKALDKSDEKSPSLVQKVKSGTINSEIK